jgi:hypothetical protein
MRSWRRAKDRWWPGWSHCATRWRAAGASLWRAQPARRAPGSRHGARRPLVGLREADELDDEVERRDYGNWQHAVLDRFHRSVRPKRWCRRTRPACTSLPVRCRKSRGWAMHRSCPLSRPSAALCLAMCVGCKTGERLEPIGAMASGSSRRDRPSGAAWRARHHRPHRPDADLRERAH